MSKTPIQIRDLSDYANLGAKPVVDMSSLISVPYTTILNRAQIPDISKNLKASMGIDRIQIQEIFRIQSESGPNGELVYGVYNDPLGLIRVIGDFVHSNLAYGPSIAHVTNNFSHNIEITFYGTGLNVLCTADGGGGPNITAAVDGGSQFTVNAPSSHSTIIGGRNYCPNEIYNVVKGLALGIHTVNIRRVASNATYFSGFEILNETSNVTVNPGTAYLLGEKIASKSQALFSYNSVVTGTKGGRVLVYMDQNGNIQKAFTPTAASPSYTTSANHANEEVARIYHWLEFNAGRGDDFSNIVSSSGTSATFTLDDGTTNLQGLQTGVTTHNNIGEQMFPTYNGGSNAVVFTFVGTGLDIVGVGQGSGPIDTHNIFIDEVQVATISTQPPYRSYTKIASGLPYGTHCVRIVRAGNSVASFGISQLVVYQPATPSLPSGCVSLGAYNVLANYIQNTTVGNDYSIGQGVIRKQNQREFVFTGTGWTNASLATGANASGYNFYSTANGDSASYTFFGTGFDLRFIGIASQSATCQLTLDGSTNFTGYTTFVYGGTSTFTASTGVLVQSASSAGNVNGCGVAVAGLTLGVHTITITRTTGTTNMYCECLDIITPIHAVKMNLPYMLQNTLSIGSQGIQDMRSLAQYPLLKTFAQATGITSGPSTSVSANFVPAFDLTTTVQTTGNPIDIYYSVSATNNTTSQQIYFQLYLDGEPIGNQKTITGENGGDYFTVTDSMTVAVGPGNHKIDVFWHVSADIGFLRATERTLIVKERS